MVVEYSHPSGSLRHCPMWVDVTSFLMYLFACALVAGHKFAMWLPFFQTSIFDGMTVLGIDYP